MSNTIPKPILCQRTASDLARPRKLVKFKNKDQVVLYEKPNLAEQNDTDQDTLTTQAEEKQEEEWTEVKFVPSKAALDVKQGHQREALKRQPTTAVLSSSPRERKSMLQNEHELNGQKNKPNDILPNHSKQKITFNGSKGFYVLATVIPLSCLMAVILLAFWWHKRSKKTMPN